MLEIIGFIGVIFLFIILIKARGIDENNLDNYDREWQGWESGTSRGIFGGVYDSNGDFDFWKTFTDTNPSY